MEKLKISRGGVSVRSIIFIFFGMIATVRAESKFTELGKSSYLADRASFSTENSGLREEEKSDKSRGPATKKSVGKAVKESWKVIQFEVREGTWLNLDISPDGKYLLFDLLGDIYILPVGGGMARAITSGPSFDHQPRWSPDGKKILFVSDASGRSEVWTVNPDGTNPVQITLSDRKPLNYPVWSPNGKSFLFRKRIPDWRTIGTVELWLYNILGGRGIQLTKGTEIGDANDPAFSPDGRYIYFSARGRHRYNRNVHSGIWNIQRLDLITKKREVIAYSAFMPRPSPDGRFLALLRRIGRKTVLFLRDLETNEERLLTDLLDRDDSEGFAPNGTYPNYCWSPDSGKIYLTAYGKIWSLDIASGKMVQIPFRVKVEQYISPRLRPKRELPRDEFLVRVIRWFRVSPRVNIAVWSALSKLWFAPWPKLRPIRQIDTDHLLAYAPVFSGDGGKLAYVTWSDRERGAIWIREVKSSFQFGSPEKLPLPRGYYSNPSFSPDGNLLAFSSGAGTESRGFSSSRQNWVKIEYIEIKTGRKREVVTLKNRGALGRMPAPQFSRDGTRIFFTRVNYKKYRRYTKLCSVRLDGTDELCYWNIYGAEDMVVSPGGDWMLFWQLHNIYAVPMPWPSKDPLSLGVIDGNTGGGKFPVIRLSKTGGYWPSWSGDAIYWTLGPNVYRTSVKNIESFLSKKLEKNTKDKLRKSLFKSFFSKSCCGVPSSRPATRRGGKVRLSSSLREKNALKDVDKKGKTLKPVSGVGVEKFSIDLRLPVAKPGGCAVLKGLTVIPMTGEDVVYRDAVILIRKNIIRYVGTSKGAPKIDGCAVFELKGKFALPGFIDTHAHMHYFSGEIFPQNYWAYYANLAYGVTSILDPSAATELVFTMAERIRAGMTTGPRIFSTGFVLYGAESSHKALVRNYREAKDHIIRLKAFGAWGVKSYMQPSREQRLWLIRAAREENIAVYPEGGGDLALDLTLIIDGHTGVEHSLPIETLYGDVIGLLVRSGVGYTPTLLVSYGGLFGEIFFYQNQRVWDNSKLRQFFPPRALNFRRHRNYLVLDSDWHFRRVAESAAQIARRGGEVHLGSHGQLQGLGYHWEARALASGGLSPYRVLEAATIGGAKYLGLEKVLGTLENGKLADIVILDRDPRRSIDNLSKIALVVKNGVIFRASDMYRIYPNPKSRPRFLWEHYAPGKVYNSKPVAFWIGNISVSGALCRIFSQRGTHRNSRIKKEKSRVSCPLKKRLIELFILSEYAREEIGLSVSDGALEDSIYRDPAFSERGRFSRYRFDRWLKGVGLDADEYRSLLRRLLLVRKLEQLGCGNLPLLGGQREDLVFLREVKAMLSAPLPATLREIVDFLIRKYPIYK